jgi:hypothetical protein
MKMNTDTMDPDEEWVDTMRSPTFRLYPGTHLVVASCLPAPQCFARCVYLACPVVTAGDPLPDDLQGIFTSDGAVDILGEGDTTEETSSASRATHNSADPPHCSGGHPGPVRAASERFPPHSPVPLSDADRPRSATYSPASTTATAGTTRCRHQHAPGSSGSDASSKPSATSPADLSSPSSSVPASESSNGHPRLDCAPELDGVLVEDYVCQHMAERIATAVQSSPASSGAKTRTSRSLLPLSSPKPLPSSMKKDGTPTSASKKKTTQFVSSEKAATKEIMALFMG